MQRHLTVPADRGQALNPRAVNTCSVARIIRLNRLKSLWSPVCTAETAALHLHLAFLCHQIVVEAAPEIMHSVKGDPTEP